ncbi:MAG: hypothetical protein JXR83_07205 [Deltaproteobacteria bacterium]|nr:hypothetical protein [Deltaproteobacteria bacterium]
MKSALFCLSLLLGGAACSDRPRPAEPPAAAVPAPPPVAAAAPSFGGSCTVTTAGSAVCTDHSGPPASVQERCAKAATAEDKSSYSPDRCPTAGRVGACALTDGSVQHYYQPLPVAAMQKLCSNRRGTWVNP